MTAVSVGLSFVEAWNNHPLRKEGNKTPEQIWHVGMMLRPVDQPENLEVRFSFSNDHLLQEMEYS